MTSHSSKRVADDEDRRSRDLELMTATHVLSEAVDRRIADLRHPSNEKQSSTTSMQVSTATPLAVPNGGPAPPNVPTEAVPDMSSGRNTILNSTPSSPSGNNLQLTTPSSTAAAASQERFVAPIVVVKKTETRIEIPNDAKGWEYFTATHGTS